MFPCSRRPFAVERSADQVMCQCGVINVLRRFKNRESAIEMVNGQFAVIRLKGRQPSDALDITEDEEIRLRVVFLDDLQLVLSLLFLAQMQRSFGQNMTAHVRTV